MRKARIIAPNLMPEAKYDVVAERSDNVIGRRISQARKRRGYSLARYSEVLAAYGIRITPAGINKWEVGLSVPNAYQLIAICQSLGIEEQLSYFIRDFVSPLNDIGLKKVEDYRDDLIASGKYKPTLKLEEITRRIDMRVFDLPASAGTGSYLDSDQYEMMSFPENTIPAGAEFGIRVSGDSMENVYKDGQIVWVQECDSLNVGEVGIMICDDESFIKVYGEKYPDEDVLEEFTDSYGNVHMQPVLISYNEKYADRVISPSSMFKIVGRVL